MSSEVTEEVMLIDFSSSKSMNMLVRVWTTGLVKGKEKEYETFAHEFSVPMFQRQPGILGVTVLISKDSSHVLTYWNREEDILQMENNLYYKETVKNIKRKGLLALPQRINVFHAPFHYFNGSPFPTHAFAAGETRLTIKDKYLAEFSSGITFDLPQDFKL